MQIVICKKYFFAQNKYKSDTKDYLDLMASNCIYK